MIGEVLKQVLAEKNMNVNELSERIGVSNQTLYSIIKRNNMKVDFCVLLKICSALNVNIERFYGDYLKEKNDKKINELIILFEKLTDSGKDKVIDYTKMVYASENSDK